MTKYQHSNGTNVETRDAWAASSKRAEAARKRYARKYAK